MKKISSTAVLILIVTLLLVPMLVTNASAAEKTRTYTFSSYTAGTQYALNEEHALDEYVTMYTTQAHFTTQLRLYSSSDHNGYAIIESKHPITAVSLNAGNKEDTVNIYGSDDGTTWTNDPIGTITTTTTSYKDYTTALSSTNYKYLKLDVAGTNQVRIASMSLTFDVTEDSTETPACEHTNTTTTTVDATCTTAGYTTVTCDDCGEEISKTEIPATGHSYENGICTNENCGQALPVASFVVPNGIAKIEDIAADESGNVTLPAPGTVDGYTFVGWSTTELTEETTTAPTVSNGQVTIDTDTTYYAIYSYEKAGESVSEYVLTDINSIEANDVVVITMSKSGNTHALPNDKGASTPSVVSVTISGNIISGTVADNLKWNISNDNGSLTIYPNGDTTKWLYCTNSNSGVRVGTDANYKTFTIDSNYLKNTERGRYIGVYNNQDWRSYTSINTNITGQTLGFYVLSETVRVDGERTIVV